VKWSDLKGALAGINLCGVRLALTNPESVREYVSYCLRKYDDLTGCGLPHKDPIAHVCEEGWGVLSPEDRAELPTRLNEGGGVNLNELLILATVTRVLRPKKILEIGTYTGRTTSVLILNAPLDASIITLDLPPEGGPGAAMARTYLDTDVDFVKTRKLAACLSELRLEQRCEQVLCDSLEFDPSPHRGTVELGFIDGAHALPYVKNDTLKMAVMAADRGLIFWHDYGGKGRFRPLTLYLEALAERIPIYHVRDTTLAWSCAADLRKLAST
jgi:hypothetical protein